MASLSVPVPFLKVGSLKYILPSAVTSYLQEIGGKQQQQFAILFTLHFELNLQYVDKLALISLCILDRS